MLIGRRILQCLKPFSHCASPCPAAAAVPPRRPGSALVLWRGGRLQDGRPTHAGLPRHLSAAAHACRRMKGWARLPSAAHTQCCVLTRAPRSRRGSQVGPHWARPRAGGAAADRRARQAAAGQAARHRAARPTAPELRAHPAGCVPLGRQRRDPSSLPKCGAGAALREGEGHSHVPIRQAEVII